MPPATFEKDTVAVLPSFTGPPFANVPVSAGEVTVTDVDADPEAPYLSVTATTAVKVPATAYACGALRLDWVEVVNVEVVLSPQFMVTDHGPSLAPGSVNEPRPRVAETPLVAVWPDAAGRYRRRQIADRYGSGVIGKYAGAVRHPPANCVATRVQVLCRNRSCPQSAASDVERAIVVEVIAVGVRPGAAGDARE